MSFYIGGLLNLVPVEKYSFSDLAYQTQSPNYGGTIRDIFVDDAYVLVAGNANVIKRYNAVDLSYINESVSYGGAIWSIAVDNDYVYAAGQTTRTIVKYNRATLGKVSESSTVAANTVRKIILDGAFLYAVDTSGYLYKFDKSTLALITSIRPTTNQLWACAVSSDYVIVGGSGPYGALFNKNTLAFVANIQNRTTAAFENIVVDPYDPTLFYCCYGAVGAASELQGAVRKFNVSAPGAFQAEWIAPTTSESAGPVGILVTEDSLYIGGSTLLRTVHQVNKSTFLTTGTASKAYAGNSIRVVTRKFTTPESGVKENPIFFGAGL